MGCLLAVRRVVVWTWNRQIRLDRKQIGERIPLLIRELPAEAVRAENSLPLRLRHLAKIAEGAGNQPPPILRQAAELLHGPANLLPLRQSKTFHGLSTIHDTATFVRRHVVQLSQTVAHTLLRLWRKIPETGLIRQSPLLVRKRKVAMSIHPLGQMFLVTSRT
jgi:hypothetical protein